MDNQEPVNFTEEIKEEFELNSSVEYISPVPYRKARLYFSSSGKRQEFLDRGFSTSRHNVGFSLWGMPNKDGKVSKFCELIKGGDEFEEARKKVKISIDRARKIVQILNSYCEENNLPIFYELPNLRTKNTQIKLNEEKVKEIKSKLKLGNITVSSLSKEYGVSKSTIHQIREGFTWVRVKI